ncbi:MAG TPA: 30S ribosomal protein S6e [Candidatus Aenigmarchaeota archaeon]|nr:30S ribosomal protein S6e [Candidatus Aenigmarchaeota archaeon]
MATFKFVVNDPETRRSYQVEIEQSKALGLIGKKIGDEFSGDIIGLPGYTLKITGGTDKDGFPMHPQVEGMGRKKVLLTGPPCFHPKRKGERRRKTVRGNTISEDIAQINCKIVKKGEKPIEELIPVKKKEAKAEKPKEEIKAEKKPEAKPEEKVEKEEAKEEKKEAKEEKKQAEQEKVEAKPEEKKPEAKPEVKEEKKEEEKSKEEKKGEEGDGESKV